MKTANKKRIWIYRLCAILILIAIGAAMFVIGRGHTVYFDNKTLEAANGETYSALQRVVVRVNGEQVAKLSKRERGMSTWMGQNFKAELEVTENKGDEPKIIQLDQKLPYSLDGIVINLPAYLAGAGEDIYLSEFVSAATVTETAEDDEDVLTDEFGTGDF